MRAASDHAPIAERDLSSGSKTDRASFGLPRKLKVLLEGRLPSPGAPGKLSAEHKAFLAAIVAAGPIPAIHGVVRWRACDLIMQLHEKFSISVSDDTVYRALKELGFSHVSARPKAYRQDPEAMEAFKKTSPSAWRKSARSLPRAHR